VCLASLAQDAAGSVTLTLAMLLAGLGLALGVAAGLGTGLVLRRRPAAAAV
jgi:hypothetical protein